jgi:hypothetical protein
MKSPDPDMLRYLSYLSEAGTRGLVFDVLVVLVGLAICYMGYRLLSLGLYRDGKNSGELQASVTDKVKLSFKNFAPGTVFALCGAAMIASAVWRPPTETSYQGAPNLDTQPIMVLPAGMTKTLHMNGDGDRIIQKALRGEPLTEEEKKLAFSAAEQLKNLPPAPIPATEQPNQLAERP